MSGIINSPRHGSHPDRRATLKQIDAPQSTPANCHWLTTMGARMVARVPKRRRL